MKFITLENLNYAMQKVSALFVKKELKTGSETEYRTLSDNNLTDALVEKINAAGVATEVTEDIANAKSEAIQSSNGYTDTEVGEALAEAKAYADTAESDAVTSSNSYTDAEVSEALAEAKSYADTAEADAVTSANAYTDTTASNAKTEAIESSNSYTDTEVSEALTEAKAYADTAESDAVASAKSYTDTTAESAKTEAVSTAKTYTDEQVEAAKTALQADINTKISTAYKVKGSTAFANLPAPSESEEGNVYNITEKFTTTDVFLVGAGEKYPAGTNVVCVEESEGTFKYDILHGFIDTDSFVLNSDIEAVTEGEIDAMFAA